MFVSLYSDGVVPSTTGSSTTTGMATPTPTSATPAMSSSAGAPGSTADDRATEFRAVEGGPEMRSGAQLLVTAYALIWLFLLAWLVVVWRKQNALTGRLQDIEAALDVRAAKAGVPDDKPVKGTA